MRYSAPGVIIRPEAVMSKGAPVPDPGGPLPETAASYIAMHDGM
jgi:hypothetical protein